MGNLSCGNLDPPPSSGGQSAASSPSALHEDGLTKRFRRCRSPFREPPKSDRHPVGIVIAIISESRSASPRNADRRRSEYAWCVRRWGGWLVKDTGGLAVPPRNPSRFSGM